AHRAGAAHLRSAEPAIGEIRRLVLGDPVECIEHTHPLAVRDAEFRKPGGIRAAHTHGNEIALRKPPVAGLQGVMALKPPKLACFSGCEEVAHHATSRLFLTAKSGLKKGRS